VETTQLGVRKGDRVYVDTQLDGGKVFARNIRVESTVSSADARGQVVQYDSKSGAMVMREELSSQDVTLRLNSKTGIRYGSQAVSPVDLRPGSLVDVRFAPGDGGHDVAQEISIIAMPGTSFVFAGRITYLDLHLGTFAVDNRSDQKLYELHFDPASTPVTDQLVVGADVTVRAVFDGTQYVAGNIAINRGTTEAKEQ
jgi:hypothetical protein